MLSARSEALITSGSVAIFANCFGCTRVFFLSVTCKVIGVLLHNANLSILKCYQIQPCLVYSTRLINDEQLFKLCGFSRLRVFSAKYIFISIFTSHHSERLIDHVMSLLRSDCLICTVSQFMVLFVILILFYYFYSSKKLYFLITFKIMSNYAKYIRI